MGLLPSGRVFYMDGGLWGDFVSQKAETEFSWRMGRMPGDDGRGEVCLHWSWREAMSDGREEREEREKLRELEEWERRQDRLERDQGEEGEPERRES